LLTNGVIFIGWSAFALPLFCMPAYVPIPVEYINWASVVFFGFTLIAVGWYVAWGHKNYAGPPTEELRAVGGGVLSPAEELPVKNAVSETEEGALKKD